MARYVLRRLVHAALLLVALSIAIFFATHLLGDPASLMLRPEATAEQYEQLRENLGVNDPLPEQFFRYMGNLARGDFGVSIWQGTPALAIVLERLPRTLYLAGVTLGVAVPLSVLLGIVAALRPRSIIDRVVNLISLAGASIADFWLALMLILVFAVELRWFPTSGFGGVSFVILPALALALRPMGRISQVVRSSMLEEAGRAYVTTARGKGLAEPAVTLFHTLKNAAIPIITLTGDEAAALLNGAVVIETVFGWPGVGILLVEAIQKRDLPLIEACVMVIAIMVITLNLCIDLLYSALDPRVRYR